MFLSSFCSLCLAQLRNDVGVEKKHQDNSNGRERLPTRTARFTHKTSSMPGMASQKVDDAGLTASGFLILARAGLAR